MLNMQFEHRNGKPHLRLSQQRHTTMQEIKSERQVHKQRSPQVHWHGSLLMLSLTNSLAQVLRTCEALLKRAPSSYYMPNRKRLLFKINGQSPSDHNMSQVRRTCDSNSENLRL